MVTEDSYFFGTYLKQGIKKSALFFQRNFNLLCVTLKFSFVRHVAFLFFLFFLPLETLFAQPQLNRMSVAKRSDGKGYVVRLHLSQSLDSAKIIQPSPDSIQVALYLNELSTEETSLSGIDKIVKETQFFPLNEGVGINMNLSPNLFFIADIYPDGASEDWLIGLTNATEADLDILTNGVSSVDWSPIPQIDAQLDSTLSEGALSQAEVDSILNAPLELSLDDNYDRIKDNLKFDLVVIDAGHGGHDPGSIGFTKTKEKKIALIVAKKLGAYIEENLEGVKVVYTRKDDSFVELEERGHIANRLEGDLFISIHCNANRSSRAYGSEVFFLGPHKTDDAFDVMMKENSVIRLENNDNQQTELSPEQLVIYELTNSGYMANSQRMAALIDQQFSRRAGRRSRGIKQAGFMVLYFASMPAVLVELGFITNPNEERFLNSDYGQSIMASAIFRAVREYKNAFEQSLNNSVQK